MLIVPGDKASAEFDARYANIQASTAWKIASDRTI
jgi:hypothetical protein